MELEGFVNRWPAVIRGLRRLFRIRACIGRDLRSTGSGCRPASGSNCCSWSQVTFAPICRGLVHARCRPRMPIASVSVGAQRPRRARSTAGVRKKAHSPGVCLKSRHQSHELSAPVNRPGLADGQRFGTNTRSRGRSPASSLAITHLKEWRATNFDRESELPS